MRLSRQEAIAKIKTYAKEDHPDASHSEDTIRVLASWAIFTDDVLMDLQRVLTRAVTMILKKTPHCPTCRCLT